MPACCTHTLTPRQHTHTFECCRQVFPPKETETETKTENEKKNQVGKHENENESFNYKLDGLVCCAVCLDDIRNKSRNETGNTKTFISCLGERNQSDLITFIRFDVHSTTTISKVNDGQDIVGDDDDDHGHALF